MEIFIVVGDDEEDIFLGGDDDMAQIMCFHVWLYRGPLSQAQHAC